MRAFFADLGEEAGDTLPSRFVGGIVDEAQDRDEIADVLSLKEFHPGGDVVGNAHAGEGELRFERHEVRSIEHGDFGRGNALIFHQTADALDQELGLFAVIHRLHDVGFGGIGASGAEFLVEMTASGLGHQYSVGEFENLRRRTVVGFDPMNRGAGMTGFKRHQVFEISSAPGIDTLGVIADGHDAVMGGEFIDDLRLDRVGVLILIDQ